MDLVRIAPFATAVAVCLISFNAPAREGSRFTHRPPFIKGEILRTHYDGVSNDLLTGGLGTRGLAGPTPAFADPAHPTAEELRTAAIYNNYRALVDMSPGGGYGTLYGPNVTADGKITDSEGLIAGTEYLAYAGHGHVTMMVQIPDSFDPAQACIVTGPSSGSRGVYGAIATAGDWGLKHGCAVAYTDKGTGAGVYDMQGDTVNLIRGRREDADAAGKASNFTPRINDRKRAAFNAATPNRFAFKHAHSQRNPEKDWGRDVLESVEFAFYAINRELAQRGRQSITVTPENTLVIGSSVSNGGGASIRAAEEDRKGLIDGVAVSEPNVNPRRIADFAIVQGDRPPFRGHSRPLYDYDTLLNLYQGCANRAPGNLLAPYNLTPASLGIARCTSLHEMGLLTANGVAAQAEQAQRIINDAGFLPEQNILQPALYWLYVPQAIVITYANAYGRFGVEDNLCGYSFGATTGNPLLSSPFDPGTGLPIALSAEAEAAIFATANGIPPTGGVNLINNRSLGGARENRLSVSPSTGLQDQNVDGALCLRALWTGVDSATGQRLRGRMRADHRAVVHGVSQILASGDLHGLPVLIVQGRADGILPPNHTSRAYFGLNRLVEGARSKLSYIEVTHGHHLDSINALAGFDARFIPLHHYFIQAMNLMYAHLKDGAPLPPSQVVHTVPRGRDLSGIVPPIEPANLPAISMTPGNDARIVFDGDAVRIPE